MDGFGIQITRADIDRWLLQAADYALPRVLQTVGQLVLGVIVFVVLRWVLNRIDKFFSSKTVTQIDDHFIEATHRIGSISVVVWVLWRTAHIWGLAGLASLAIAAWIVALSLPLADLVSKLLTVLQEEVASKTETALNDTALPLLIKAARILTVAGGIVIALSSMNVDIMPFVAGASVLGVAIGFAAKDTLSNLIAGVLLIVDRPFHVGDRIELWTTPRGTGTWGDVIEIGLRATKIRNPDNLIFVIPNNEIMRRDIVNYTASGDNIRLRIPISIAYDANQNRAKEVVRDVALKVDGVLSSPEPQVIIRDFGESSIDLQLRVWIADARKRRTIGDEITDRVKDEFDRAGIEIPYATRNVYIRSMPAPLATEGSSERPGAIVDSPDGQDQKPERQTKQGKADE